MWGLQTPWEADAWGFLAKVCDVDEVLASVSGFGCGSGSGSPIDLCGSSAAAAEVPSSDEAAEAPLGTSGLPIDLCSSSDDDEAPLSDVPDHCDHDSSVESCSVSPREVIGPGDEHTGAAGFVEAPADGPPFQFYCLLLTLSYEDAVDFECACHSRLGVQHTEVPFGGRLPLLYDSLPATLGHFFVSSGMLVMCGQWLHGLWLSWLCAVWMVSPGCLYSGGWLTTAILSCAPAGTSGQLMR